MGVKILSLYDGMACGMIAMLLAGVPVESYDAYEIDKYAIKVATHNFPNIKEHGDVFEADFTQYEGVDFLVGGSPCTYWSIAQTKNRETVASGMGWELFSQYVRALKEAKPKYFIYENNKSMSKQIRASIDDAFGFEAICINSALVSAQNRQRLYWVGRRNEDGTYSKVNVEQPADRGILLKDVLDNAVAMREKAHTIDANYYKGGNFTSPNKQSGKRLMAAEPINTDANGKSFCVTSRYYKGFGNNPGKCLEKHRDSMVAEPVCLRYERTEEAKRCRKAYEAHEIKHGYNELNELHPRPDGKTNTLTTVLKDNQIMEPVCVAERGRMYCGQPQHYEARTDGKTNTLTSVEKDNRVAEPVSYCTDKNMEHLMRNFGSKGKIVDEESKTPTLMAAAGMGGGNHIYYANSIAEPVNVTADGKSQTLKAQYCKNNVANFCCYSSTYGASGVAEPVNITQDGKAQCLRATCYKDGIRNIVANDVDKKTGVAEPIEYIDYVPRKNSHIVVNENAIRCAQNKNNASCAESFVEFVDKKSQTLIAGRVNKIIIPAMPVKEATAKGYTEIECGDCVDLSMPNSKTRRGRNMADKANCMQTSNEFYQYVGYVIEFDDNGRPIKAIGKDGKAITIYEVRDGKITIKGKQYPIKLRDGYYIIRKLTVSECKRLQTVPEWYDFSVISNSQAFKCLGNGWTCQIICHLINSCFKPADVLPGQMCLWG